MTDKDDASRVPQFIEIEKLANRCNDVRKAVGSTQHIRAIDGIVLNAHYEGAGAAIYKHACALGCEGIVSKRLGSPYRAGRTDQRIKVKNPAAPAVKREAEEDWAR